MHLHPRLLTLAWLAGCALAAAQPGRNEPRLGYISPAGACRGGTVEILAGGQNLRAMREVRVSGTGVEADIVKAYRQTRNLDGDQRELLRWRIACRRAELNGKPQPPKPKPQPGPDGKPAPEVVLPESPFLDKLGTMGLAEIQHWVTVTQRVDRMQPSPQLGELIRIEIRIAANAEPGMRELRLGGPQGFTNPLRFEIGTLTEHFESEPNEHGDLSNKEAAALPCTFNGQVQSGDVDVFRFRARRGGNLVVRGEARSLIPYLADAVPGWFQMVLTVRDAKGREVAYGDDFRFDPDPVVCFKVPEDGDYQLEVRDSIYRGREDFVYRISVGELPFVAAVFPLGGREGEPLVADARGWNLPGGKLRLDTNPEGQPRRTARMPGRAAPSNEISYAVDKLPELMEAEPNDHADHAAKVGFPCIINGRIDRPGDADVFRIDGRKGEDLIVEVLARRLGSPLDSVVHVADERGTVLGWNDDSMVKDGHLHLGDGLLTHHADSRVRVKPQADGPLFIRIADTQLHGGPDYAYRLRLCDARPDFELRVSPSALNVAPGAHVPLHVHVLRNDGFDGEIKLDLKDAPTGFQLSGARIPAGVSQVRITLATPAEGKEGVITPVLTGTASQNGKTITRSAIAADDSMQAFLWRHLVPADEWLVSIRPGRGKRPPVALASPLPLRIPVGGAAELRVNVSKWLADRGLELEPSDAPAGIRFSAIRKTPEGIAFDVMADAEAKAGFETNLIVDLYAKAQVARKGNKARPRYPVTTLPAIPITLIPSNTP
jgi:hypothetical protein